MDNFEKQKRRYENLTSNHNDEVRKFQIEQEHITRRDQRFNLAFVFFLALFSSPCWLGSIFFFIAFIIKVIKS